MTVFLTRYLTIRSSSRFPKTNKAQARSKTAVAKHTSLQGMSLHTIALDLVLSFSI